MVMKIKPQIAFMAAGFA